MKRFKQGSKKTKGYVTLVVVILLIPFLLLQGVNLVNISVDIIHVSTNSITNNKQYIEEQTCWEEILYSLRKNNEVSGEKEIPIPEITCKFFVTDLGEDKYKITLETEKEGLHSFSERYVFYDSENIRYISLQ